MSRGTGQTTQQLLETKLNGVFICLNHEHVRYTRHLARFLGREDIRMETVDWILRRCWQGLNMTDLVVDHFAQEQMRGESLYALIEAQSRVGRQ